MKIQIDLKSALCGLAVGIAVMFVVGADSSSHGAGRYQISSGNGQAFMIDTLTGQAWGFNAGAGNRNDGNFFDSKGK